MAHNLAEKPSATNEDVPIPADDLKRCFDVILSRHYDDVDYLGHNSGQLLRNFATELRGHSLHSVKLLAEVSTQLNDVMTLSAWTNGNAQKMVQESASASSAVEEIAAAVRDFAGASDTVSQQAADMKSLISASSERVQSTEQAMEDITVSFDALNNRLQSLDGAIEAIGGFAKDIEAISNQTKLLALNATIEAARAGEAGKGFAVVASEVKSLSEQTSKTTEMIAKQLGELDAVMQGMIETMTDGGAKVREGSESFNQVSSGIGEMLDRIHATDEEISAMRGALSAKSDSIDAVVKNVVEIAELSKRNSEDSLSSLNVIRDAQKKIAGELATYENAHLPNQAVWRLRADHLYWKKELAECLVGLKAAGSLDTHSLARPFGIWLARVEGADISSCHVFRSLTDLELPMRDAGNLIVRKMEEGNIGDAIGLFFEMDEKSTQALDLIQSLERMAR